MGVLAILRWGMHHREQKARGGGGCCFDCFNARSEPRVSTGSGSGRGTSEGVTQSYVWLPPDYWDVDNRQTQGSQWAQSRVLLYFENRELGQAQVWNILSLSWYYISSQAWRRFFKSLCWVWLLTVNNEQFWWNHWHANSRPFFPHPQNSVRLINIHFLSLMVIMSYY